MYSFIMIAKSLCICGRMSVSQRAPVIFCFIHHTVMHIDMHVVDHDNGLVYYGVINANVLK